MKAICTCLLFCLAMSMSAQVTGPVQSICDTAYLTRVKDESIALAIIAARNNGAPVQDSIELPYVSYEQVAKELSAIYGLHDTLPDVDTIFDHLSDSYQLVKGGIVPFLQNGLHTLTLTADTSAQWVKNFARGVYPTGDNGADYLISHYSLSVIAGNICCSNPAAVIQVSVSSASAFNPFALGAAFNAMTGISGYYASLPENVPGNDWSCVTRADSGAFISYLFKYSFGDCNPDCSSHHYWLFKVYTDCRVEEDSSWGDRFVVYTSIEPVPDKYTTFYPNPTHTKFIIGQNVLPGIVHATDMAGHGYDLKCDGTEVDTSQLDPGIYVVQLYRGPDIILAKIVKD